MPTRVRPKSLRPNPLMLQWALSQSGLQANEASLKDEWLQGQCPMTYPQLEAAARKLEVPLATFFLDAPPGLNPIFVEFRQRLQEGSRRLHPKVTTEVRRLLELQENLFSLGILPPSAELEALRRQAGGTTPHALAHLVRTSLQVNLGQQCQNKTPYEALNFWRDRIQSLGLYVITVEDSDLEGMTLCEKLPVLIGVSAKYPPTARQFTLTHELYHAITGANSALFPEEHSLEGASTESAANEFAATLLLPLDSLEVQQLFQDFNGSAQSLHSIARTIKLSYAFVLRQAQKLFALNQVQLQKLWSAAPKDSGTSQGGDYYRNQVSRYGNALLNEMFARYDHGQLSPYQVASLLKIKVEQFDSLRKLLP